VNQFTPKYPRSRGRLRAKLVELLPAVGGWLRRLLVKNRVRQKPVVVTRKRRWQVESFTKKGIVGAACILVVAISGYSVCQVLKKSDIFRLTTVAVYGNSEVDKTEIFDLGNIVQGRNLLSMDVEKCSRAISSHPWIESVQIKRLWPSRLTVNVREFKPIAMINVTAGNSRGLYYVDGKGRVFAKVEKGHELDFPVITGVDTNGHVSGSVIEETGLTREAFTFIMQAAKGNPIVPLQTISEVNVSSAKGIVVYLVDRPFPIYMGYEGVKAKYNRLVTLLDRLYRKKKIQEIKEIRMDYFEGRILVAKVE